MPLPLRIALVIPTLPHHGAAGRWHALRVAGLLTAQGADVTLVTEHLPPEWPALCPGPLPRCLAALPPGPRDWLLLAAPARGNDPMIAAALAQAAGSRLGLLEAAPGGWTDWPAGPPGLLLSVAPAETPAGWRQEVWAPHDAAPLLADILLRSTAAVAPRPGEPPPATPATAPLPPVLLRAARCSSGGDLLLTLRDDWPGMPDDVRAHSPGGPALPLLRQGDDCVVIAPPGLAGHPVVLRATGGFGHARRRLRLDTPPPPPAAPAVCTLLEDLSADGWRLLRGEIQAAEPLAALRFSPDGTRWLEATLTSPTGFLLEYRPTPQDDPQQARLLLLAEDHTALDLLVGWPPRPGRHQPGFAAFGIASGVQAVVAGLAARLPGLRAVLSDDPALLSQFAFLPPEADIALLPFADADAAARVGGLALADAVTPVPDPLLAAAAPVLALDGIGAAPDLLARAIAAALPLAEAAGLRLAVVVDAPPLEPMPSLRARLALPDAVLPIWPEALAAAGPETVRALADLGTGHGVPAAVALSRGIPAGLWAGLALPGASRPWPCLSLPDLLAPPEDQPESSEARERTFQASASF